jgi:hypothetical protein
VTTAKVSRHLRGPILVLFSLLSLVIGQSLRAQVVAPPRAAEDEQGAAAPAGELKMVAAIASTNYDRLINNINFVGSLIGQPNISEALVGQLATMTGGKGLAGMDKTKPWGLILQTDGTQFLPMVCLPVTNADDIIAALAATGAEVKDGQGGMKELALPNGTVYIKNAGGWMFLSKTMPSLARVPANPQTAFATLLSNYDIAAQAKVQNVPVMYRQMAILTMQAAMQQQLLRQPGEADEEFAARKKAMQTQIQQAVQQVQELDTLTLGFLVDVPKKQTVLEFTYKVIPSGTLAKQFAAYGEPRTNFAGFRQSDAAATFSLVAKADPEAIQKDLAQFEAMINGARAQFNKRVDENADTLEGAKRDTIKAAAGEWFDALEATLKSGQIDGAASLFVSPDSLSLVAGAVVQDPAKIESGLKKLDEEFKGSEKFEGVKWNAGSHEGVNFHTLSIPVPPSEDGPAKLLGEKAEVAFGIGPQAVYLAVGKDNLNALTKAIDASKADPNKLVPPFEVSFSFAPLMEVAATQAKDEAQRARAQAVSQMLRAQAPDRDHVRIIGQMVPNGLRYRIEAEEGALQAILMKAMEARQNAAAGP